MGIAAVVVGGILVVAGIAWVYLMRFLPRRGPAAAAATPWSWIEKLADWLWGKAEKVFPKKEMPGVFMIITGTILIVVTLTLGSSGGAVGGTPTTSTTTDSPTGTS